MAQTPAPDEITQGLESIGMLVVGDARDVGHYSGTDLGYRYLCRAQGPFVNRVKSWPCPVWGYHATEQAARAMYTALRAHALSVEPALEAEDTRGDTPLNVPTGMSESFWLRGSEVMRMVCDRMADLQVAVRQTEVIRRFEAHPAAPEGAQLLFFNAQNDVLYLAYAASGSGAAEHLVLVSSPRHEPQPVISQGMPRALLIEEHSTKPFPLESGFAIAFWGRVGGHRILAPAQGRDPAEMLHAYLGQAVALPLRSGIEGLDERMGGVPTAYAIRMEPGDYVGTYHELEATGDAGYSYCAVSRLGARPFQPTS
jgi:hypothetical protein